MILTVAHRTTYSYVAPIRVAVQSLRLTPSEVWTALSDWRRLLSLLGVNFLAVPPLTVAAPPACWRG